MEARNHPYLKAYSLWGWVLLVVPAALCVWWIVVASDARSARQAKELFLRSCPLDGYYDVLWMASAVLSAVAFFFATRLARRRVWAIPGFSMLLVSAVALGLSVAHLLAK